MLPMFMPMFTDPKKGKKRIKVGEKRVGKKRWEKRKGEREMENEFPSPII